MKFELLDPELANELEHQLAVYEARINQLKRLPPEEAKNSRKYAKDIHRTYRINVASAWETYFEYN